MRRLSWLLGGTALAVFGSASIPGCYQSAGNDFRADVGLDVGNDSFVGDVVDDSFVDEVAHDPFVDDVVHDPVSEDVIHDEPADDGGGEPDAQPPPCDTLPLEVATEVEYMGDASPRTGGAMVYDARRDRMLVFGGLREMGDWTPDVVVIYPATNQMGELGYEGEAPEAWASAGGAWDEAGERIFIVGGMVVGHQSSRVIEIRIVDDESFAWRSLPDTPDGRWYGPAAGYDPEEGRLVIFSGYDGTSGLFSDRTWVIRPDVPGDGWRQLEGAGGPDPQIHAIMAYVPGFGLVLIAHPVTGEYLRQIFVMRRGSEGWEEITLDAPWLPSNRPAVFWDSDACRLIVWEGGCPEGDYSVDLFASPAIVTPIEIDLLGVLPRLFLNATLDTSRRQVVVHGGYDCDMSIHRAEVERLIFE